jgi:hypothetical protein
MLATDLLAAEPRTVRANHRTGFGGRDLRRLEVARAHSHPMPQTTFVRSLLFLVPRGRRCVTLQENPAIRTYK